MKGSDEYGIAKTGALQWRSCVVSYILAVVLIAVIFCFFLHDWNLMLQLVSVDPWWMVVIFLMLGAGLVAQTFFLRTLVMEIGGCVVWRECFCLVAAANMLSMLTPPPTGGAYRAYYLRSRHGVDVLPFASGTTLFVVVGAMVWCIVGIVGLISSGVYAEKASRPLLIVVLVFTSILFIAWWAQKAVQLISNGRLSWIADGTLRVTSSRWVGTAAFIAAVSSAIAQVVGFYVVLRLFGLSIGVINSMSILAFHQLSGVIALTPGGVGIQEGAGVFVASVLGMDVTEMVFVFALTRVARVTLSILVGGVCWWRLPTEKTIQVNEM